MQGTFLEATDDPHVALRRALLVDAALPEPAMDILSGQADSFEHEAVPRAQALLLSHGLCLFQLDYPLSSAAFASFARGLGQPVLETDPQVQSNVEHGVLLHLRTSFGPTQLVGLQPFSASFLTMHSESSGHAIADQPRYIALQCLEPGDLETAPQTVIASMQVVASRLSADALDVLSRTRYDGPHISPAIARREGDRWVLSFRDFHRQSLAWVHDGPATTDAVQDALRELLSAMYATDSASAVRWTRGLMLVLDNQRWLHGRTEGRFLPGTSGRHLLRARIRAGGAASNDPRLAGAAPTPSLFERMPVSPGPARSLGQISASLPSPTPGPVTLGEEFVDERVLEVFSRARDPHDATELHELWLGRVEAELGSKALHPDLAHAWRASRPHRNVHSDEVLSSRATVGLVKGLFNTYFRDEVYGALSAQRQIVLSNGSVHEQMYGLPEVLKETLRYALDRDWYGYSDSRGREAARRAVAALESGRMQSKGYGPEHVVLTLGATQAIAALADFLLQGHAASGPALCGIPNYPPLVQAVARRHALRLVPTPAADGMSSLAALSQALTTTTPFVLLQTGCNPCGSLVDEAELERFIEAASPSTMIVLDECHEWLGAPRRFSSARRRANVVRVSSLSKEWSAPGLKIGWFLADPALVHDYYEHASTAYGGPASLMYTLVEVLARFESWREQGMYTAGPMELSQFSGDYGLRADALARAFEGYAAERVVREQTLLVQRESSWRMLQQAGIAAKVPRCSINLLAQMPGMDDSYRSFRTLLRDTGVSLYPGALAFRLAGGSLRLTTSRPWPDLHEGLQRLCDWPASVHARKH